MAVFFKAIAGLLIYREPKNKELGFELLEDPKEGSVNQESEKDAFHRDDQNSGKRQEEKPEAGNDGGSKQNEDEKQNNPPQNNTQSGRGKPGKKPVKLEDWNEGRKSEKTESTCQPPENPEFVSGSLCDNLITIRRKFDVPKNQDIIIRDFKVGRKIKAFMVYIDGMIDKSTLNLSVFTPLMSKDLAEEIGEGCPVDFLLENVLTVHSVKKMNRFTDIINQVLGGVSALFIEGCSECIMLETRGYEKRSVEAPKIESVVQGPQEGFTENLRTNLTLVRRIIKNEKLITEMMTLGKMDNSNCAILYLEGIANPKVIQEVKKRLGKIDTNILIGNGMIGQFIEDNTFSLFPQVLSTERPDRTASFLMEGQVVIIGEGAPYALVVPVTFFRLFHTSEDTFVRWPLGTFLRLIRLFGLFCATLLPGLYVAVVLFHPEMIPTELLTAIAKAKESVPFPTVIEVLIMEVSFELIREGGIRVPIVIGQTLGIVGALILGQAAVMAGLVSPVVVIVVSITALGSFVIPNYTLGLSIRLERFFFIFAGGFLGFYGIALLIFLLAVMVCSMKSFGEPFFAPVAPRTKVNPDVILRYPVWTQKSRPDGLNTKNRRKQGENVKLWISEKEDDGGNGGGKS